MDLFSYHTVNTIRPTRPRSAPPAYPFTLVRFANNAPLILPPEPHQRRREISPLAASETFTQRQMRRIGAGSPRANGSVNGASIMALTGRPLADLLRDVADQLENSPRTANKKSSPPPPSHSMTPSGKAEAVDPNRAQSCNQSCC